MFEIAFWGVDVAGESINKLTLKDERFFLITHDHGLGVARYARRYCIASDIYGRDDTTAGWVLSFHNFRQQEEKFNIRYLCVYPTVIILPYLEKSQNRLFNYIRENYFLKEIGFTSDLKVAYLILEKGQGEDFFTAVKNLNYNKKILRRAYQAKGKEVLFYSITLP